jgi:hypothetical protein
MEPTSISLPFSLTFPFAMLSKRAKTKKQFSLFHSCDALAMRVHGVRHFSATIFPEASTKFVHVKKRRACD